MIGSVTLMKGVPVYTYATDDDGVTIEDIDWPPDVRRQLDADGGVDYLCLIDYRLKPLRGAVVDLARTALRAGACWAKVTACAFVTLVPVSSGYDGDEPVVRDAMAEWALSGRVTPTADLFDAARFSSYRVRAVFYFDLRVRVDAGRLSDVDINLLGEGNTQSASLAGLVDELADLVVPPVRPRRPPAPNLKVPLCPLTPPS